MKMLRVVVVGLLCGVSALGGVGLPVKYLKGTYNVVHEGKEYLSPAWGCNWYRLGVPKNMYRYGQQTSPVIMMVKELFNYYPDERILRPTNNKSKIVYYFTPSLIGAIINEIENELLSGKEEKKEEQSLAKRIEALLNENLKNAEQWQELLKEQTKKKRDELEKQYNNVQKKIENAQNSLKKATTQKGKEEFEKVIQENKLNLARLSMEIDAPKAFGQLLADSIEEVKKGDYLAYTMHWILLSFLWAKAETKEAILEYFDAFNPSIVTITDRKNWLSQEYTQEEYVKLHYLLIRNPEFIVKNKQHSLFYSCASANDFYGLVEDIPYQPFDYLTNIVFEKDSKEYEFSDCGENSTRNFINSMVYDPKTKSFDLSRLKAPMLSTAQSLLDYYQTYSTQDVLSTREAHTAWVRLVSDLPDVSYKKSGVCEITGGLPSVLKLLNHLLFGNDPEFDKKTNSQKMQYIFDSFSSKEFPLTWSEKDNKDINKVTIDITIKFTIAEKFPYEWAFQTGHYKLQGYYPAFYGGRDPIFQFLKNKGDDQFCFNIITWYISQLHIWGDRKEFMKLIGKKDNTALNNQFLYMQNLDDETDKNSFLNHMARAHFTPSLLVVNNLIESEAANQGAYINLLTDLAQEVKIEEHKDIIRRAVMRLDVVNRLVALYEHPDLKWRVVSKKQTLIMLQEVKNNINEIKKNNNGLKALLNSIRYVDKPEETIRYLSADHKDSNLLKAFLSLYAEGKSAPFSVKVGFFEEFVGQLDAVYLVYFLYYVFDAKRNDLYFLINKDLINRALQADRQKNYALLEEDLFLTKPVWILSYIANNKIEELSGLISLKSLCAAAALNSEEKEKVLYEFLKNNMLDIDQQEFEELDQDGKKLFINAIKKTKARNYHQYLPREDQ